MTMRRLMLTWMVSAAAAGVTPRAGADEPVAKPERSTRDARDDRPQVTAAVHQAVSSMRDQIERTSVTRHVTVGDFLQRLHAEDDFAAALIRAEMVGGPRWV